MSAASIALCLPSVSVLVIAEIVVLGGVRQAFPGLAILAAQFQHFRDAFFVQGSVLREAGLRVQQDCVGGRCNLIAHLGDALFQDRNRLVLVRRIV